MMLKTTRVLPLAAAVLFPVAALADEPVELAWKWTKGEAARYRMTVRHETKVTSEDYPEEQSVYSQEMVWRHVVEDVDEENGTATLRVTYEAVRVEASQGNGQEMVYDSREEPAPGNPALLPLASMVGQPFTMTVDARGNVRSLVGLDRVLEAKAQEHEDDPMLSAHFLQSRQIHGDEASREQMQNWMRVLPEGGVEPGQEWDVPTPADRGEMGTLKLSKASTFRGVEDREGEKAAVISQSGTYELSEEGRMLPEEVEVELKEGEQEGQIVFSTDRGRLMHSENASTLAMSVLYQGTSVLQVMQTRVVLDLLGDVEEEPAGDETPDNDAGR